MPTRYLAAGFSTLLFQGFTAPAHADPTGDLTGHVLSSADSQPVPSVRVQIAETGATTTTNGQGAYYFKDVAPGSYTVVATPTDGSPIQHKVTITAGRSSDEQFKVNSKSNALDGLVVLGQRSEIAPTQGSLLATEPQSVVSQQFIENNLTGMSNYIEVAALAPSVWAYSPNGPGGNDNPGMTVRGFQDGQYNVLFDGIPFSDGADFTHHATSYMTAADTGSLVVDRGPGRASDIGDATFGGTIASYSKNPLSDPALTARLQYGTFASRLVGIQFDTGEMQNYGGADGFIDFNNFSTGGALTNNIQRRSNVFGKLILQVSESTSLTIVAMQNWSYQHASLGATAAEIVQYGPRYGLNLNPASQAYQGYNYDQFTSNFDYLGLQSHQGNWKLDNKLYTNAYRHDASQGQDPNGATPNTVNNGIANNADIPGITALTQYTTFGNVFRATDALGNGDLGMGIWVERQLHHSWNNSVDLSNGGQILALQGWETSSLNTYQPYLEYVWRPNYQWSVTPGLKYNYVKRDQRVLGSNAASGTYHAVLPSLDVHFYVTDHWSAYVQAAEGFVAPILSYLASANPNAVAPQKTNNFQLGSVFTANQWTVSGDVYYITNNNLIQQVGVQNGLAVYQNAGSVQYRGIEGEATYKVVGGLSLYGNYSLNSISSAVNSPVLNAPKTTAALGLLYGQGPVNASLLAKQVGSRITGQDAFNNNVKLGGYAVANLSAGYKLNAATGWAKNATLQFQVENIFNRTDIIAQNGRTQTSAIAGASGGDPLFWTLYGRIFNISLSASF
jgi:iron complex outermembrane recepter protein